ARGVWDPCGPRCPRAADPMVSTHDRTNPLGFVVPFRHSNGRRGAAVRSPPGPSGRPGPSPRWIAGTRRSAEAVLPGNASTLGPDPIGWRRPIPDPGGALDHGDCPAQSVAARTGRRAAGDGGT